MMVFGAAHVVVDQGKDAFRIYDSGWAIFAAWAAAAAAIATATLAWLTRNLANATKEMVTKTAALAEQTATQAKESALAIEQAQRHHEQALMPIVWVLLDCENAHIAGTNPQERGIVVEGQVINSGPGPAISIYLHLKASSYIPQYAIYLGLVGPNMARPFKFVFSLGETHQALRAFPYDCVTRYTSIFDTEGAIVQHSYSGLSKHAVVARYIAPSRESVKEIKDYLTNNGFPTQTLQ